MFQCEIPCILSISKKKLTVPRKLQGISYWNWFYELTLRDRNMQARICLKVFLKSWGLDILVSSTSLHKSNIGWSQQTRQLDACGESRPSKIEFEIYKNWSIMVQVHFIYRGPPLMRKSLTRSPNSVVLAYVHANGRIFC